jgi:hypothetical protein
MAGPLAPALPQGRPPTEWNDRVGAIFRMKRGTEAPSRTAWGYFLKLAASGGAVTWNRFQKHRHSSFHDADPRAPEVGRQRIREVGRCDARRVPPSSSDPGCVARAAACPRCPRCHPRPAHGAERQRRRRATRWLGLLRARRVRRLELGVPLGHGVDVSRRRWCCGALAAPFPRGLVPVWPLRHGHGPCQGMGHARSDTLPAALCPRSRGVRQHTAAAGPRPHARGALRMGSRSRPVAL